MSIYVFLNGSVSQENIVIEDDTIDEIIAVDGGFNNVPDHLKEYNLRIIGDLDSINREYQGYTVVRYPKEKDLSDFELALNYISNTYKNKRVRIYGLLGGRIDHQLFNIFVLYNHIRTNNIVAYGDKETIYFSGDTINLNDHIGSTFSIFPLENIKGLTIKGAKYTLENNDIRPYSALTLSNIITDELRISVKKGIYALIINI